MATFWERKIAEINKQNLPQVQPQAVPSTPQERPWWANGTSLVPAATPAQPGQQEGSQGRETGRNEIDGHDISKASILKGNAEQCPNCPVDPDTGIAGNFYRPSASAAMRCFDCGYISGREIHDINTPVSAIMEGPSQSARQVNPAGGYRGDLRNAEDIGALNVALERSAIGQGRVT